MKELSIEEKAKRYDEAIEKAKIWQEHLYDVNDKDYADELNYIFPELKVESEDEKIRKWIIENIQETLDVDGFFEGQKTMAKEAIAWLEKQGEKKPDNFYCKNYCKGYQETGKCFADGECDAKRESEQKPKFEVGDSIKCKTAHLPWQKIEKIDEHGYKLRDYYTNTSSIIPINEQDEWELVEQNTSDKVEPKFHEDDWISGYYTNYKVMAINSKGYAVEDTDGNKINILFENEKFHHLFTIADAKDGDVLVCGEDKRPFIFKGFLDKFHPDSPVAHCGICCTGKFLVSASYNAGYSWWTGEEVFPATTEQRDLLFLKMHEAGYEWDAEKKELKKIEQKPAWSEEDEEQLSFCCAAIELSNYSSDEYRNYAISFLESLKDRVQPQPKQEWNEKDLTMIESIIQELEPSKYRNTNELKINWLKSLKDRVQPKQEWGEEDEEMMSSTVFYLNEFKEGYQEGAQKCISWLKSIKDGIQPKPEWSEEDKKMLDRLLKHFEWTGEYRFDKKDCDEARNWLKSLRPQNRWKPSDEQIKACKEVYADILSAKGFDLGTVNSELNRLEEQLKKLSEE